MFVYLTSKRYPATTADHVYIRFLARAFSDLLGKDFILVVAGAATADLAGIAVHATRAPRRVLRVAYYFLWFPWFINRLPKAGNPHVVFANDFNLLAIAIFWKPLLKTRYAVTSDWHLLSDTWKDRYVMRGSDHLVTTSRRLRDELLRIDPEAAARAEVVYGGIDTAPYREPLPERIELGLPARAFLVGYVGLFRTMGKEKGIGTMIEALDFLPEDVIMAFVGGSELEIEEYRTRAGERASRCVFIERQPVGRVPQYERSMDALVIPYPDQKHFRDYGFPMKAYEYLAAGRPVIYSGLKIMDEVLRDEGAAFVPDDPKSLATKILEVRERRERRTSAAADIERYSWKRKAELIAEISTGER